MKEFGAKIPIIIILVVLVLLASLVFDLTEPIRATIPERPLTYEEALSTEIEELESLQFDAFLTERDVSVATTTPVKIDSNPLAKSYEEIIQAHYNTIGVNFAGHFSLVTWSCGVGCQTSTIIDVSNGDIVTFGLISTTGASFSPTSRLLIINPYYEGEDDENVSSDYYVIDEEGLELVAKVVAGENILNECLSATTTARNPVTNETVDYASPCKVPFGWEYDE